MRSFGGLKHILGFKYKYSMEEKYLKIIAEQLTRIANLLDNQEKREIVEKRKDIKKVRESVKARKNELLRNASGRRNGDTRRN